MRKFSLLLGTLGGAMAGYLFSNRKLRKELARAKNAEEAAKVLGRHLQRDGKKVAYEVQKFVQSPHVQDNLQVARKYAEKKFDDAKDKLEDLIGTGVTRTKKSAMRTAKQAKKVARRTIRRVKAETRKLV